MPPGRGRPASAGLATGWQPRVPTGDGPALDRPPAWDPEEPQLRAVHLARARLTPGDSLDGLELTDVVLSGCDVAGLVATGGRASGLMVRGGRIRGVTWVRATFRDARFDDVIGDEVSLRFTTLRRVEFRNCTLPGLDLTEVTGERVRFVGCDLREARFDHARIDQLGITGCNLTGATGVEALRRARVHPDDVASMALSLAVALGITVTEAVDGAG